MKSLRLIWTTSVSVLAVAATMALAASPDPWKVQGRLDGEVDDGKIEKAENVSGIACAPAAALPRLCLVVDDETQGAQIVLLHKDSLIAGEFIPLSQARFKGKPVELDAEAVAHDGRYFYVAGSHGRPRHELDADEQRENIAKAEASRFIFRIALQPSQVDMATGRLPRDKAVVTSATLTPVLQRIPEIAAAYDKPLDQNGLTIEGLAAHDGRLYVGLRGPVIGSDAAIVSVDTTAVFDGGQAEPRLHRLMLGADTRGHVRGVRDIARHGDGFLVLAGPVNDPKTGKVSDGDYAIYVWDGSNQPQRHANLAAFGRKVKPEALLPLSGDTHRARVLVMFDGPEEGAPTPLDLEFSN